MLITDMDFARPYIFATEAAARKFATGFIVSFEMLSVSTVIVSDIKSKGQSACHDEQKTCKEESINVCMKVMYKKNVCYVSCTVV
jgi:hypothetical protein